MSVLARLSIKVRIGASFHQSTCILYLFTYLRCVDVRLDCDLETFGAD
jgi:hypothetical protein